MENKSLPISPKESGGAVTSSSLLSPSSSVRCYCVQCRKSCHGYGLVTLFNSHMLVRHRETINKGVEDAVDLFGIMVDQSGTQTIIPIKEISKENKEFLAVENAIRRVIDNYMHEAEHATPYVTAAGKQESDDKTETTAKKETPAHSGRPRYTFSAAPKPISARLDSVSGAAQCFFIRPDSKPENLVTLLVAKLDDNTFTAATACFCIDADLGACSSAVFYIDGDQRSLRVKDSRCTDGKTYITASFPDKTIKKIGKNVTLYFSGARSFTIPVYIKVLGIWEEEYINNAITSVIWETQKTAGPCDWCVEKQRFVTIMRHMFPISYRVGERKTPVQDCTVRDHVTPIIDEDYIRNVLLSHVEYIKDEEISKTQFEAAWTVCMCFNRVANLAITTLGEKTVWFPKTHNGVDATIDSKDAGSGILWVNKHSRDRTLEIYILLTVKHAKDSIRHYPIDEKLLATPLDLFKKLRMYECTHIFDVDGKIITASDLLEECTERQSTREAPAKEPPTEEGSRKRRREEEDTEITDQKIDATLVGLFDEPVRKKFKPSVPLATLPVVIADSTPVTPKRSDLNMLIQLCTGTPKPSLMSVSLPPDYDVLVHEINKHKATVYAGPHERLLILYKDKKVTRANAHKIAQNAVLEVYFY